MLLPGFVSRLILSIGSLTARTITLGYLSITITTGLEKREGMTEDGFVLLLGSGSRICMDEARKRVVVPPSNTIIRNNRRNNRTFLQARIISRQFS